MNVQKSLNDSEKVRLAEEREIILDKIATAFTLAECLDARRHTKSWIDRYGIDENMFQLGSRLTMIIGGLILPNNLTDEEKYLLGLSIRRVTSQ